MMEAGFMSYITQVVVEQVIHISHFFNTDRDVQTLYYDDRFVLYMNIFRA